MYHNFSGETGAHPAHTSARAFRQQLAYIKRHYRPIRLKQLAGELAGGGLPPRSVAITVDDGHANFLHFAFPLLQEFQIPATIFVVSDLLDTGEWFWEDKWAYVYHLAAAQAPLLARHGDVTPERIPAEERDSLLDGLARRVGVAIPPRPPAPYTLASCEELKQLAGSDLIDIGSHSRTHQLLNSANAEESWDEIDGSRRELERRLSVEVASFCYPYGLPSDYRPDQAEMVARAGYLCATAAHFGYVTGESNLFALPRIGGDVAEMTNFRKKLDGFEYLQRRFSGERYW